MKYLVAGLVVLVAGVFIVGYSMWFVYNYWWVLIIVAALAGGAIFMMKKQKAQANRV